jgi:fructose-bisphosphate aldolase class I
LNALNVRSEGHRPWALSFSFGRALQQPALELWNGDDGNTAAAQQALAYRAKCNSAARRGEYTAEMESK